MRVPHTVIEAELHFLLDVAEKIIGRHPARVNVEGGLTSVRVEVDHLKLHRVPGRSVGWADEAALPGRRDPGQLPGRPEREINQFDVMDRDISARIAAADPFGE